MAQDGPEQLQRSLTSVLQPLADPTKAYWMRAYMRNQFDFLGISAPGLRAAVRPVLRNFHPADSAELLAATRPLWNQQEREYQYAAVELLVRHQRLLTVKDLPQLLKLVRQKSWWDTVDALAKVVGAVVRRDRKTGDRVMDRALRSRNLWVRRVAMLHQLGWRADTDAERLFSFAKHLAPETEFFIRKAIGWALRDYAKHDPEAIRSFLLRAGDQLAPLSCREAGKHLHEKFIPQAAAQRRQSDLRD